MSKPIAREGQEVRAFTAEFRVDGEGDVPKIVGYAAVFNSRSEDIGFWEELYEEIEPGAFAETIGKDDVVANINHDSSFLLGRNTSGTLKLSEDDKGLLVDIETPDTTFARDLVTSIRRKDITGMSFAFRVLDSEFKKRDGKYIRILQRVQLFDVSVVAFPAYKDTDVGLRSFGRYLESQSQEYSDDLKRYKELEEKQAAGEGVQETPPEPTGEERQETPPEPTGEVQETPPATPTAPEETRETQVTPETPPEPTGEERQEIQEIEEVVEPSEDTWQVSADQRKRDLELIEALYC